MSIHSTCERSSCLPRGTAICCHELRWHLHLLVDPPFADDDCCFTATARVNCREQSPNVFVEKCLQITLLFLKEHMNSEFDARVNQLINAKCSLEITLQADNDFYSQIHELQGRNLPVTANSLKQLPKFQPCPRGIVCLLTRIVDRSRR